MKDFLAALDLETIPQLSLGTAALLIFGACAALAVFRGLLRIIAGSLVLCLSGLVAYFAWRHAPVVELPGGPWIAPVVAGAVAFFVLRALLRFAVRPFGNKAKEESAGSNKRSPVRWIFTTLFSLIPAGLLWFTGAAALRNIGSVAEIRHFVDGDGTDASRSAFLAELKGVINRALPEALQGIDPLADDARVTLAKLIALGDGGTPPKAIPVLGEPEIRSLILHDPELRKLAKQKRYADILRDPRLDHVMADPDLKKLLAGLHL